MTPATRKLSKGLLIKLALVGAVCALIAVLATLFACAPSTVSTTSSGSGTANAGSASEMDSQPVNWTMESDCTTCHTVEAESLLDTACPQAYAHQNETTCVDCHTEETLLQGVHEGLTFADASKPASKPTMKTVPEQTCISCHGTLADMAAVTVGSTALTDDQKTSVNPHERPAGQTHEASPATCTDCHNNHSKNLERDAMKYCATCHHRGIFTCGNCHEVRTRS